MSSRPSRLIGFADQSARGGTCCSVLTSFFSAASDCFSLRSLRLKAFVFLLGRPEPLPYESSYPQRSQRNVIKIAQNLRMTDLFHLQSSLTAACSAMIASNLSCLRTRI